jgi:hypothetical protein
MMESLKWVADSFLSRKYLICQAIYLQRRLRITPKSPVKRKFFLLTSLGTPSIMRRSDSAGGNPLHSQDKKFNSAKNTEKKQILVRFLQKKTKKVEFRP